MMLTYLAIAAVIVQIFTSVFMTAVMRNQIEKYYISKIESYKIVDDFTESTAADVTMLSITLGFLWPFSLLYFLFYKWPVMMSNKLHEKKQLPIGNQSQSVYR